MVHPVDLVQIWVVRERRDKVTRVHLHQRVTIVVVVVVRVKLVRGVRTDSSTQADGGDGKSSDILGTVYWWSGGGGGAEHSNPKGSGGKGGGGVGAWGSGTSTVGGSPDTNGISDAEASPGF